ncbi:hypothetical protein [Kitasatospora sp. GAS1066B]|uniref:hypothetical protein n=1 Tax=Kitasatospora sp. GAS1066B TaxID=3156271 RepID=UPI00351841CA
MTRDDVLTYLKALHGRPRHSQLVALRSLFSWAKRNGLIFRNPTSRIKVGPYEYAVLQPLVPEQVDQAVAAATTPATRLILAFAAVHAARVAQIGTLMLDDVDVGNRRLSIAGRVRPLDDLTLKLLLDWLAHRRTRWPNTANRTTRPAATGSAPRCAARSQRWSGGEGERAVTAVSSRGRSEQTM